MTHTKKHDDTEWTEFTPTITGYMRGNWLKRLWRKLFGVKKQKGYYRKVGNRVEFKMTVKTPKQ